MVGYSDAERDMITELWCDTLEPSLEKTYSANDAIHECGPKVLSIIRKRPLEVLKLAHHKLHSYQWKDVPTCWRRAYTEASYFAAVSLVKDGIMEMGYGLAEKLDAETYRDRWGRVTRNLGAINEDANVETLQRIIKHLDMALIVAGAPGREGDIGEFLGQVTSIWAEATKLDYATDSDAEERPSKRSKLSTRQILEKPHKKPDPWKKTDKSRGLKFKTQVYPSPPLDYRVQSLPAPTLETFTTLLAQPKVLPLIITGILTSWPALSKHPWSSPSYLLSRTAGGRRLVPVEIGRSYTDVDWSQRIIPFQEFLERAMLEDRDLAPNENVKIKSKASSVTINATTVTKTHETKYTTRVEIKKKGSEMIYLAQHDLLDQMGLRSDILIPDYCYVDPPPASDPSTPVVPKLDGPVINAWLGPGNTISPLHTDPYHNILAQAVGSKYIRLYAPDQTKYLYPKGIGEDGVSFENTSSVDITEMMELFDDSKTGLSEEKTKERGVKRKEFEERYPGAKDAEYVECVLKVGECLFIPVGWWHYVRSLSSSFSVSFWWN